MLKTILNEKYHAQTLISQKVPRHKTITEMSLGHFDYARQPSISTIFPALAFFVRSSMQFSTKKYYFTSPHFSVYKYTCIDESNCELRTRTLTTFAPISVSFHYRYIMFSYQNTINFRTHFMTSRALSTMLINVIILDSNGFLVFTSD